VGAGPRACPYWILPNTLSFIVGTGFKPSPYRLEAHSSNISDISQRMEPSQKIRFAIITYSHYTSISLT
ncbi:MAG: hypothetical protein U9N19_02645, partial [Thermodesulfobacteriota bacterium]|nr:hypothetical protein [Thermodesulfobacteriota bacterium]